LKLLSDKLDAVLGKSNAAIHWDLARSTLQAARGMPTLVGVAADPDLPDSAAARSATITQAQRR